MYALSGVTSKREREREREREKENENERTTTKVLGLLMRHN